jgi:hypothetical protein
VVYIHTDENPADIFAKPLGLQPIEEKDGSKKECGK